MLKGFVKRLFRTVGLDVRFAACHDAQRMQQQLMAGIDVMTVVDAGAYHGEWTAIYRKIFPTSQIFAFEPFVSSVKLLQEQFGHDAGVQIIPKAIGDVSCNRTFYCNRLAATNSLFPITEGASSALPDPAWVIPDTEVTIPVTTLDEFCTEQEVHRINVLKMDIQGGELLALRGAEKLLRRHAIDLIYTELLYLPYYQGQSFYSEICTHLHERGYKLFGVYNLYNLPSGQLGQTDAIFLAPRLQVLESST